MSYIVFSTLVLLITLLGVYVVIENNRKKAREAEKKVFNDRLKKITSQFKSKTSEFVEAKALRPKYSPKVNAIVGNFFVVQAHTEENLDQLERIAEQFIYCVVSELNKCRENGNLDLLSDQLQYFVAELPTSGISYNKEFYQEILPALIIMIKTPEQGPNSTPNDESTQSNDDATSETVDENKATQKVAAKPQPVA
ncbi:hypothetical protein CWB96_02480 [Pseudoalteromonas citrea]|uniref:Uncharacterized protein n=1 Tax=Pseudoalteromonas citrea TaxID=43655 RepID=A0A5S3XVV6_9GAMM|nr:hypothetical protein [Pseudoalteromonas citrea]TMP43382.1 hypothetical protein CWB97_09040 [Pseudoalteromonas citrea]TMP62219.1 hypothetical protein CWB96_02480 [Pseudoalteromonas citrea]